MIDIALDGRVFLYSELDNALQELDLLFNTINTELIGDTEYGTNFEQFLWQMNPSPVQLKEYILEKINHTTYLSKMQPDINISILNGEYRNIYHIKIDIHDDKNVGSRVYQLR